eukprot:scaffold677776_cov57-Prasinocladus_malaysianus.AAC.1
MVWSAHTPIEEGQSGSMCVIAARLAAVSPPRGAFCRPRSCWRAGGQWGGTCGAFVQRRTSSSSRSAHFWHDQWIDELINDCLAN